MKSSEAIEIVRTLTAAYHRESLDPETVQLWVAMVEPFDAEIATKVALSWVKGADKFPTISQFRHAYHGEKGREAQALNPAVATDAFGLPVVGRPEWVKRYEQARAAGDMRVFPEQIADGPKHHSDPRYTLAEADEIGVMPEDAWR